MPRFVVERPLPNVGHASREEQVSMAKVSDAIIKELGSDNIRWVESVFTVDKIYCFYDARDLETVREHSTIGGFPYDRISEIRFVLDRTCMAETIGEPGVDA